MSRPKGVKNKKTKETPVRVEKSDENISVADNVNVNEEKEKRRKFLLDLQETCARERITGLSDIERKLEELERM